MKRSKIVVTVAVLCCILLLTFVACTPNADSSKNEFKEFQHIMSVVLDKFSTSPVLTMLTASSGDDKTLQTSSQIQDIFADLDKLNDKESCTLHEINHLAVLNLISAMTYAQLLNEYGKTDKIYGIPMQIYMGESTQSYANAIVSSQGTHKIAYLYSKNDTDGEMLYVYDINYINDKEFSAISISLNMEELKFNDNTDTKAATYFMYADTNDASLFMDVSWNTDSYSVEINYKKSAKSDGYYIGSMSETVANNCFKKVKSYYSNLDFKYIRSLKAPCDYEFTWEQYLDVANKLGNEYGIDV